MQWQLRDKPLNALGSLEASGSFEDYGVQQDMGIEQPQTRATARQSGQPQTQAIMVCPPQSNNGGGRDNNSMQMTSSREGSKYDSREESDFE